MTPYTEMVFEYRGHMCAVLLMPMGHRCGYVGIPKGKPYYGCKYGELDFVDCHGGLTYSEDFLLNFPVGNWWIGFDCMHYYDRPDIAAAQKAFGAKQAEIVERCSLPHGQVRSMEYCMKECRGIVDQLIAEAERDD